MRNSYQRIGAFQRAQEPPDLSRRILVVAPEPFYEDRGTPIALKYVLEAGSERGYEVDLLTFPVGKPLTLPGLRIFRVGTWLPIRVVPIGFSLRKVFLDAFLLPAIFWRTSRVKYACVYALEESAFLALLLRPWHKLFVIYDMQSSLPEQLKMHPVFRGTVFQKWLHFFERWMIRKADRIVCSAGLRKYVQSIVPDANVQEWYFPMEPAPLLADEPERLRAELGIEPGSRVVLYAGNFESYQGVERLLEAVPRVLSEVPEAVFLFVGVHATSDIRLTEPANRLREQGIVRMIPRQSKEEIKRFLAIADVAVSPRDNTSNVGIKIFEYMSAGKAIVATDTHAHRELLGEDRAVLVNPFPDEMAKGIIRLLQDREAAVRLGQAARTYAEKQMNRDRFLDQVEGLYREASG